MTKLLELERSFAEALDGLTVYGQSTSVRLEDISPDDWIYGYLSFHQGKLNVGYRSTEDDFHDSMSGVPEEYQTVTTKPLSECSAEWLGKLAVEKTFLSLTNAIEDHLDELNNSAEHSVSAVSKIFDAQSSELNSDVTEVLKATGEESLVKAWVTARTSVTTEPADSITRSSSYIESVCRKILRDFSKPLPAKKEMANLIGECVNVLGLSSDKEADADLKQLVGGVKSICQAVGSLRTHFGTAHGSSPGDYKINEQYARLANNAAATVTTFLLQRHQAKKLGKNLKSSDETSGG